MKNLLTKCWALLVFVSLALPAQAQFTLLTPADSTSLDLNSGMPTDTVTITWTSLDMATDYLFHLDTLDGSFAPPQFSTDSLPDTALKVTYAFLDSLLGVLGVDAGDSLSLLWTVTATTTGTDTVFADTAFVISLTRFTTAGLATPSEARMTLFPNPARNQVHLKAPLKLASLEPVQVSIYDLQGRQVFGQKLISTGGLLEASLDLPTLSPGLYTLSLRTSEEQITEVLRVK